MQTQAIHTPLGMAARSMPARALASIRCRWLPACVLITLACLALAPPAEAARTRFGTVVINNVLSRRDTDGNIIDAHDGCLKFFNGRYYLYGTFYGKSAGYGWYNRYRVYSSPDLVHWTFDGELLKSPPDGVYYRPYVAYNPRTGKYVLWYNWYPKLFQGHVGVAVSDTPVGPFTIVHTRANVSQAADRPGDGSLFVDNDGTGYFIYSVIGQNHSIWIDRLTPDFLSSTGQVSGVLGTGCEAPAMFRHGGRYYVLFGRTCCFCKAGSGVRVYVSSKPLGPYVRLRNINRRKNGERIIAAQQTFIAQIPGPKGTLFIWMGDRWGSRPDNEKGHDFQYWSPPMRFLPSGQIQPLKNVPEWKARIEIGVKSPPPAHIYMWPERKEPHPIAIDPCTGALLPPEP